LRRLRDLDDKQHVIRRQEAILGDRLAQQGGIASHDRRVVENEPTLCPHQSEAHFLGEVKYDTGLHGGMATHGRIRPFQFPVDQFDLHALERAALDHVQELGRREARTGVRGKAGLLVHGRDPIMTAPGSLAAPHFLQ
jgi:hypothetical protein